MGQEGNQTGLGQCQASLQAQASFIPNSPAINWNFCFENGGKCQICCRGELLSEEKRLTAYSVEKTRRSSFALIRAHFRQFVKPWPHATSCQEVEHGANLRASTQMESNDAFHQPKTGSWAGVPGRLWVKPAHQKSQQEMERTLARSSQASISRHQTHVTLTNKLEPPQGQIRAVFLSHTNPDLVWVLSEEPPGKDPGPGCASDPSSFKVPLLPPLTTGAQRKVEPAAKYAKEEGSWFSLREAHTGREPMLPVLTKVSSEIIRMSDLSDTGWKGGVL